ncbi:putative spore germination protein YfkR [Paenibacillus baekrokdamisoli]|uniref:Putative spore germination protein YfkR n=1 Tax=Paenibacillus baekrokdamisoli TaxID=1712516 RepID=A0A3G9JA50_9BACL|nr:Ger(x)C family spore germination protein [Paenibacillus baekrokdamisoli]MBB3072764.1 spore germination protein KC [Paenibacillus baekrokdamisoli]BBH20154.1 putative spore germination protein YfkR [Paenibacillus baekrokdamisoli]
MKPLTSTLISLLILTLTTGCWDNNELDEYGYVQAVAIDRIKDHQIQLTTHFYNPSSKMGKGGGSKSPQKGINIRTSGETIFEAIRDIPMKFGRKAKWDHMRVILLGEQLAKTQSISEVLDYFSRDQEPRGTVLVLVAEGVAGDFLEVQPFIEQTIGQQFKKMVTSGAYYSAKASRIPLYELAIQLKSPSKTSAIPYIHKSSSKDEAVVSGVGLIKDGKLVDILGVRDTEAFMMLLNNYNNGILEFPCIDGTKGQVQNKESFEVLSLNSKVTPKVNGNEVTVNVKIIIKGTIGELRCSRLKSKKDVQRFENNISDQIEKEIQHVILIFKRQKLDAIGIGNQIYRRNPKLWKRLEPIWDKQLTQNRFHVKVDVGVLSTGMNVGTPFGTKEK